MNNKIEQKRNNFEQPRNMLLNTNFKRNQQNESEIY